MNHSPFDDAEEALISAITCHDVKLVAQLLDHVDVNACLRGPHNQSGWTPLHWAATCRFLDVIQLLLDHGANLNVISTSGYTAICSAIRRNDIAVIQTLLAAGANCPHSQRVHHYTWPPFYRLVNGHYWGHLRHHLQSQLPDDLVTIIIDQSTPCITGQWQDQSNTTITITARPTKRYYSVRYTNGRGPYMGYLMSPTTLGVEFDGRPLRAVVRLETLTWNNSTTWRRPTDLRVAQKTTTPE
jgi:hypothetical protein